VLVFGPALSANNPLVTLLVVVAVIGSAISAYYYLRLVVVMFFRERVTDWVAPRIPAGLATALVIAVLGVLYFGIFASSTIERFSRQPAALDSFASIEK